MNVLVTGGSGYVGSVLVPELAKTHKVRVLETMNFGNPIADEKVEFIKGDITDSRVVWSAMRGMDAVIHLAGVVTDDLVDMNKAYGYRVNVEATEILSEAAYSQRVPTFIYASSSSVYGLSAGQHEHVTEDIAPQPQTEYARQKLEAESHIRSERLVIVRSATCCGPAPRMRLDTVVNVFSKQAYFDHKITVHGGEQYRSNVHVQDVASFYQKALESEFDGTYNVTCDNMKVKQIAGEVAGAAMAFSISGGTVIKPQRPEVVIEDVADPRSYRLNADKARKTGWYPRFSIWQAAMDNMHWFKASGIDPTQDVFYNTKRMKETVTRAG